MIRPPVGDITHTGNGKKKKKKPEGCKTFRGFEHTNICMHALLYTCTNTERMQVLPSKQAAEMKTVLGNTLT